MKRVPVPPWLKVAVSALLLVALAWRLDLRAVAEALAEIPAGVHLAALACVAAAALVGTLRWQRALAYLGERERLAPLLADHVVGRLFNLALPTQVGGDAVRGARCARRLRSPAHAWASVLYERLVGLWALGVLALLGVGVGARDAVPGLAPALLVAIGAATAALLALDRLLAPLVRLTGLHPSLAALAGPVEALRRAFAEGLGGWRPRLELAAWSFAAQLLMLTPLALAARAWQLDGALEVAFLGVPAVLLLSMVPVTLGGFGLREALFVLVLAPFGIGREPALALAVVWVATQLPPALVGAAWLVRESRRRAQPAAAEKVADTRASSASS